MTFVDTGKSKLRVEFIFKKRIFSDYFVSTAAYDRHFHNPLDNQIFVLLKKGVTAFKTGSAQIAIAYKSLTTLGAGGFKA